MVTMLNLSQSKENEGLGSLVSKDQSNLPMTTTKEPDQH